MNVEPSFNRFEPSLTYFLKMNRAKLYFVFQNESIIHEFGRDILSRAVHINS